ncbi:hypothetical protein G7054_g2283 [Neopestalotiopsis clavispora]|nr:hypothetical protein G7054_g2283 [Neopestalotiopsis clavispora]
MASDAESGRAATFDPSQLRVVIGSAVFNYNGSVLEVSGPIGLLLAVLLNGIIAAFVGETVSELVQVFPAQNAIYLYVEQFVDEDLAWVASIAHWYCWASIMPVQMLNASRILEYWPDVDSVAGPMAFYGFTPWVLFALNLWGVDYFGWIETVGGALKNKAHKETDNPEQNSFVVPTVAFIFLGVETTAIAAYEAQSTRSIARSSQITHWACLLLLFMVTLGIILGVKWDDCRLPGVWKFIGAHEPIADSVPHTDSATIISIWDVHPDLAGVANGAIIFAVLSSANTALYISSRTLYGMTQKLRDNHMFSRWFKKTFGQVWTSTGVPAMALLVSLLAFYWLPFVSLGLKLKSPAALDDMIQIVSLTSSISCVITWTLLLIAYLRYDHWTSSCAQGLEKAGMERFIRGHPKYKAWNVLIWLQPWTARLALLGCVFIFACLSATWWTRPGGASFDMVVVAYGPHVIALAFWVLLKLWKYGLHFSKWWPRPLISNRHPTALIQKLSHLERLSVKGEERRKQEFGTTLLALDSTSGQMRPPRGLEQGNGRISGTEIAFTIDGSRMD